MVGTERLNLIAATAEHFEAALESHEKLAILLDVSLADDWLVFPEGLAGGYAILKADPANLDWGTYMFIHRDDNKLCGIGGYRGAVDKNGMVEIGYALSPEYRGQGLATEASIGLIAFAFSDPTVRMVEAHTLAEFNDSTRVLQKCGMRKIGELHDPEDGDVWHWRLLRMEYSKEP